MLKTSDSHLLKKHCNSLPFCHFNTIKNRIPFAPSMPLNGSKRGIFPSPAGQNGACFLHVKRAIGQHGNNPVSILNCRYRKYNPYSSKSKEDLIFFRFFMKIPAKLFTLHILELDRNAGDGENDFHPFLLQISVETAQRAPGNDPADHIPGEIQLEKPKCRIHMDFQNRIPRNQTLADSIGDPQTRHRTTASKPAFTERFGFQICCIAGRSQFFKYQFLREIRVYAFQRAPRV